MKILRMSNKRYLRTNLGLKITNVTAYGIRKTMTKMDTGVSKTNTSHGTSQMHVASSFQIVFPIYRSLEVPINENIRDKNNAYIYEKKKKFA